MSDNLIDIKEYSHFINDVLDESGKIAMKYFRQVKDLTLKGDSLILNQTEDGLSFGKVKGSPAVFQTRRTVEDGWVKGQALELDYDERNSTFLLKGNARLVRLENGKIKEEVSGDELSYNSDSEIYKAITEPGETRTRMTVIPKPSNE